MRVADERALSEVIGFILILAIVVVILSMYATYVVPAQGRANEIEQLDLVKDRFIDYKISLDTLWRNRQDTTTISTSFPLGTSGGHTMGGFLPMMSPVGSSAALAVNQRGETFTITSDSLVTVDGDGDITDGSITDSSSINISTTPWRFLVNISFETGLEGLDTPEGVRINTTDWCAWVNMTPRWEYYKEYDLHNGGHGGNPFLTPQDAYNYTRTDLTITVVKDGTNRVEDLIIHRDVSPDTVYDVDLMDPAYGLVDAFRYPMTLETSVSNDHITAGYLVEHGYEQNASARTFTMGEIEYRSQNHYWIQQDYYYQLGGVFLAQDDGYTCKLPPAISLYNASGTAVVKIAPILLTGSGVIGGNSPVQVQTLLDEVTELPYAEGSNSRWVNISVATADEKSAEMWRNIFLDAAERGGMPSGWYTNGTRGESYINITGLSAADNDVQLGVTAANFTVSLQNVAGATG